ncbi:GbsR/MarR family transcriptional regulator [Halobaculum sp. MBLA0147]|uniref:GbsR/MarR family transcriptional regulator n=1 Tax=Halobaculum sp. MBLA0147 TaxID=3079934 RepID=UPI003524335F
MSDTETAEELTPDGPAGEARERVIQAIEQSAEIYGLSRSYGRLYGLLYFADGPASLDALVEASGYAKSTVSTTLKDMERLHLVYRRSVPGEGKKAFYEAERDFWTVLQEFLRREVQREINTMQRALTEAEETLEDTDGEVAARDRERVRQLRQTYERSDRLVRLLTGSSVERLADLLGRLRGE